jgi:hypothetical protein
VNHLTTTRRAAAALGIATFSACVAATVPAYAGTAGVHDALKLISTSASSATGEVHTAGDPLRVRATRGTQYTQIGSVKNGATVTILCQTNGSPVTGTYGSSSLWDMLPSGGFIPDAYVKTGSDQAVTNTCAYVTEKLKRANPRGIDAAISWAFSHHGSRTFEGLCARFTGLAFGWGNSGWHTAEEGGDYMENQGLLHRTGIPPRGALVWYHNRDGKGHVVVSLGEGKVIGTSVNGKVGVAGYKYHSQYRGWSQPYYPRAGR